jgi:hypothetical protein
MEQLEQVDVVVKVHKGSGLGRAEGGVARVDDLLEIGARDLGRRDVERHDLESEFRKAQILPRFPGCGFWDTFGDVEAAIGSEAFEDDLLEGALGVLADEFDCIC